MKKYSLLLACLVISLVSMAQKPVISFTDKDHDFGKVKEEDGKITHVFTFVNKGATPLVVNRAQAQCGCTTPEWTKEPIEPGKKGTITVTYNPLGRPGPFTKTITVYSNAEEEQAQLIIKGEVIPKSAGGDDNASAYPVNMGEVSLKSKVLQMNNIEKGKVQTRVIDLKNNLKAPAVVTLVKLPGCMKVTPVTLKPGEEGKLVVTFVSDKYKQWGPVSLDAYISVNGSKKLTEDTKVTVVGNVIEDFSKMTLDQKRKAPILEMPTRTISLGTARAGATLVGKFSFSNKGQNALEIRRVINNNKEIVLRSALFSVGSGKTGVLNVAVNTSSAVEGDYKKFITVQTNDPDNSYVMLIITWKVQK